MTATDDARFLADVMRGDVEAFGHVEHLRLAYVAARLSGGGRAEAAELCEQGIRAVAGRAGQPGKFHATMTAAWSGFVAHHLAEAPQRSFEELLAAEPALLDGGLPLRFYSRERLFGETARREWVEPDLAPLPA